MPDIEITECRLRLAQPWRPNRTPRIQTLFGEGFENSIRQRTYERSGEPIHLYPRVQLKIIGQTAVLMGIADCSPLIRRLCRNIDLAELGNEVQIADVEVETRDEPLESTDQPLWYRFATPWLALNQKNFRSYTGSRSQRFRKDELSRILTGNCLGLVQSLDLQLKDLITADCSKLTSIKTQGEKSWVGFVGRFQINLRLPELVGLGKAVSSGFGTVVRDGLA